MTGIRNSVWTKEKVANWKTAVSLEISPVALCGRQAPTDIRFESGTGLVWVRYRAGETVHDSVAASRGCAFGWWMRHSTNVVVLRRSRNRTISRHFVWPQMQITRGPCPCAIRWNNKITAFVRNSPIEPGRRAPPKCRIIGEPHTLFKLNLFRTLSEQLSNAKRWNYRSNSSLIEICLFFLLRSVVRPSTRYDHLRELFEIRFMEMMFRWIVVAWMCCIITGCVRLWASNACRWLSWSNPPKFVNDVISIWNYRFVCFSLSFRAPKDKLRSIMTFTFRRGIEVQVLLLILSSDWVIRYWNGTLTPRRFSKISLFFDWFFSQELHINRNCLTAVPSTSLNGPVELKVLSLTHNNIGELLSFEVRMRFLNIPLPQVTWDKKPSPHNRVSKESTYVSIESSTSKEVPSLDWRHPKR